MWTGPWPTLALVLPANIGPVRRKSSLPPNQPLHGFAAATGLPAFRVCTARCRGPPGHPKWSAARHLRLQRRQLLLHPAPKLMNSFIGRFCMLVVWVAFGER